MTSPPGKNYAGWTWENRLKVLYFSPGLNPHDQRFLTALAGSTHEVHFLHKASESFFGLPKNVTEHRLITDDKGVSQTIVENYQRVWEEVKPDLVHAGLLRA